MYATYSSYHQSIFACNNHLLAINNMHKVIKSYCEFADKKIDKVTFCDFRGNKFALLSYWFFFQIWGKERNCLPTWKSFLFARQNLYEFSWYLFSTLITIHFLRLLFLNMKISLEKLFFVGNKAKVKAHVYHAKVFDGRLTWKWSFYLKAFTE